jgi:hypothetical protein
MSKSKYALCACGCGARFRRRESGGWTKRFIRGHSSRGMSRRVYQSEPRNYPRQQSIRIHRLRAERALGKPLPKGAQVHHVDGSKREDAPLVICQDNAYHKMLHARARVVAAGGDPNRHRICRTCKRLFVPLSRMDSWVSRRCPRCAVEHHSEYVARRRVLTDHLCECGCGQRTFFNMRHQKPSLFRSGHQPHIKGPRVKPLRNAVRSSACLES